jgi:hypothetical protein
MQQTQQGGLYIQVVSKMTEKNTAKGVGLQFLIDKERLWRLLKPQVTVFLTMLYFTPRLYHLREWDICFTQSKRMELVHHTEVHNDAEEAQGNCRYS